MAVNEVAIESERFGLQRLRSSTESERLLAEIEEFAIELKRRNVPGASWAAAAEELLGRARAERAAGRYGSAWSHLNAAKRETIDSFDACELEIWTARLRDEADAKLTNWRKGAITALLATPPNAAKCMDVKASDPAVALGRRKLKEARQIFDEYMGNSYWKIDILKREAFRAGGVLAVALILAAVALILREIAAPSAPYGTWTFDIVATMILGALGAAVSGALKPLNADRAARIPDLRAQTSLSFVRPIVGAGAAVIVVTILSSGIGGLKVDIVALPAAALVAGFSERLLTGSVAAASAVVGK